MAKYVFCNACGAPRRIKAVTRSSQFTETFPWICTIPPGADLCDVDVCYGLYEPNPHEKSGSIRPCNKNRDTDQGIP